MAESNPTQVILTDDGIKIIQAQQKAQSALTLANGKNKAYNSTSAPTSSSGYVSGDLWYVIISGIVTDMYYFDGAKWQSYLQDAATLNVGKLSALSANLGNVTTGVLHGVDIYGASFYAGNRIDNPNNTAGYYPMTITSDGAYKSTHFDSSVGMQSGVESGVISYKYRSMIGNGAYLYDNVAINGQGITLDSGTTNTKDTTFSAPEKETAYISLTTGAGLYLHGSNANIDFGGHLNDDSTIAGMYMNPYGNIIGKSDSQYWQISVAGHDNTGGGPVARFGIDSAGSNAIEFNRDLWVSNMGLGGGHQIRSKDGKGIYFTDNNSNRVDTYQNNVYYSGSVSKSLLSEKTNVKVADVNYWSNLAMSINLATYNYNTDNYTDPLRLSGIIDDVNATKEWTLPEAFYARDEDGNIVGIDNGVLLNAVLALSQEQAKEIDQLNGHNMELEARLNKLEAKLNG